MAFDNWTLPIQENLISSDYQLVKKQYRLCFKLQPPSGQNQTDNYDNWKLDYYLQAIDNPDFFNSYRANLVTSSPPIRNRRSHH